MAFPNPNRNMFTVLADWLLDHLVPNQIFVSDDRPGADPNNVWWKGTSGEVAWVIWAYESLWLPQTLLAPDQQKRLTATRAAWRKDPRARSRRAQCSGHHLATGH